MARMGLGHLKYSVKETARLKALRRFVCNVGIAIILTERTLNYAA